MNLLFVCTENKLRSATAQAIFCDLEGVQAIGCGTNADAETPLSGDLIEWADLVLVMEKIHKSKVSKKYQALLRDKRLLCLDIPDNYQYMQAELQQLLQRKVSPYLPQ